MAIDTKTWITGEEFAAEWRRLREAGELRPDAPAYRALLERVSARDRYLFEEYGRPLMEAHRGSWVAISTRGETQVGEEPAPLARQAAQQWGSGNFALWKLSDPSGDVIR